MPNILALDDWKVLDRNTDEHDMTITAEYTKPPEFCVRCGVEGQRKKAAAAVEDGLPFCSQFIMAVYYKVSKDRGVEIQHLIDEISRHHESQKSTVKSE